MAKNGVNRGMHQYKPEESQSPELIFISKPIQFQ